MTDEPQETSSDQEDEPKPELSGESQPVGSTPPDRREQTDPAQGEARLWLQPRSNVIKARDMPNAEPALPVPSRGPPEPPLQRGPSGQSAHPSPSAPPSQPSQSLPPWQPAASRSAAAPSLLSVEPPSAPRSYAPSSAPPPPPPVPPQPTVADVDRRLKPAAFFRAFPPPEDGSDPTEAVIFEADAEFSDAVEADLASVRDSARRIGEPELLFPPQSDEGSFGALLGFKSGDSLGRASIAADRPLVVIGDVHGDEWSFAAALRMAREPEWLCRLGLIPHGAQPAVVMLGDLVDRGINHLECVLLCLQRQKAYPHETVWVVGNHDIGHRRMPSGEGFVAEIEPAEFTDWMNGGAGEDRAARERFGRAYIDYVLAQPRAAVFESGLLAIHGGVPHCDLFHKFERLEDLLKSEQAKDDFTWIRVPETAPKKYPNRSRRGCEIGTEQFVASVAHLSQLIEAVGGAPISSVARGHDHHAERYFVHKAGFPPMSLVTINTMGVEPGEQTLPNTPPREPCIGVYVRGRAPRIVRIRRWPGSAGGSSAGNALDATDQVDASERAVEDPNKRCSRD